MKRIFCSMVQKELEKTLKDDIYIRVDNSTLIVDIIDTDGHNCRYTKSKISQQITLGLSVKAVVSDIVSHYVNYLVSRHFY